MKIIAVIPARGGSKSIPKKNIKNLQGQPLIAYTINEAKKSKYISSVFVSTDDNEIEKVALEYGAYVHRRTAEVSQDDSSSESVLLQFLETHDADTIVFLQCTSPFTTVEDIDGTIKKLIDEDADSALTVTPFHYFLWDRAGEGINHDKSFRPLRQEREDQFIETGAVYVMKVDGFKKAKHRFFGKTVMYEQPKERVFEIDEPFDFDLATLMLFGKKKDVGWREEDKPKDFTKSDGYRDWRGKHK